MKLFKKLISAVCALGMVASMASAFVVHADVVTPTLKVDVTYDDDTKKTGTLSVKLVGLDKTAEAIDDFFMSAVQIALEVDETMFDQSLYTISGKNKKFPENVAINEKMKLGTNSSTMSGDSVMLSWTTDNADNQFNHYNGDDMTSIELETINFKLLGDNATIRVYDIMVQTDQWDVDWENITSTLKWGDKPGCTAMNYDIPATIGVTSDDEGDDEPEITQGVITKEQSGSENDEAVWAWTTAAATGKFLKVYADVTKVGATEATAVNNIFEIPANVEATNVKVGIVVQYNPTNIAEFVVTGMEIVSSAN